MRLIILAGLSHSAGYRCSLSHLFRDSVESRRSEDDSSSDLRLPTSHTGLAITWLSSEFLYVSILQYSLVEKREMTSKTQTCDPGSAAWMAPETHTWTSGGSAQVLPNMRVHISFVGKFPGVSMSRS